MTSLQNPIAFTGPTGGIILGVNGILKNKPKLPGATDAPLGCIFNSSQSMIRLWAPLAEGIILRIYRKDHSARPIRTEEMKASENGCWERVLPGNWKGCFYSFQARFSHGLSAETNDPWNPLCGRDNRRSWIGSPSMADPRGWENDKPLEFPKPQKALIYEIHSRDFSSHPSSALRHRGRISAFREEGTRYGGLATGIDHLTELGVTHLQFMPLLDFSTTSDESRPGDLDYNWGYDPRHFFALKGHYSKSADRPLSRVREMKKTVAHLHKRGIGLVMDVVYNHTFDGNNSLEQLTPGYWYRRWDDGRLSNGSGCGNELATERPMVRRLILDSLTYLAREFHLDGFRFDLMGLIDLETMNLAERELKKIHRDILLYGEGWTGGESPLPLEQRSIQLNAGQLGSIGLFNDRFRDSVKGSVFNVLEQGYLSGELGRKEALTDGGRLHQDYHHPPSQSINYFSCHDNHTLRDKLRLSRPDWDDDVIARVMEQSILLLLLTPGVPFIHGGMELGRSKGGDGNSFISGDEVNGLDWSLKKDYMRLTRLIGELQRLKRETPGLIFPDREQSDWHLVYHDSPEHLLIWSLGEEYLAALNVAEFADSQVLPLGDWTKLDFATDEESQLMRGTLTLRPHGYALLKNKI